MKKYEIIKKNDEFNDIIKTGKVIKGNLYNIYCKRGDNNFPIFGIAVSKKCGNAVARNKIKRQTRMIIDKYKHLFKSREMYIVMTKKNIAEYSFLEMEKDLAKIIEKGKQNEKK